MSDLEPITLLAARLAGRVPHDSGGYRGESASTRVTFTRAELNAILDVYGRKVTAGEWRDYALDMGREAAAFSVYRRASECPLLRIEKVPKLARKQGTYTIVMATGLIVKRGHDLRRVLAALDGGLRLVR